MAAVGVTVGLTSSLGLSSAEPFCTAVLERSFWILPGLMVMGEVTRRTAGSRSLLLWQCKLFGTFKSVCH